MEPMELEPLTPALQRRALSVTDKRQRSRLSLSARRPLSGLTNGCHASADFLLTLNDDPQSGKEPIKGEESRRPG
ncbi:hypothetical protein Vqi01_29610 [Micromonospora qiuiae]|uniref:FXSXX-COOH protein n=1 Tax=Micromonospora qiuiae TaxID=502268 RepID=A0ABQ4JCB6_9ACTN|nr:hypothetical protein Vqi01_29610 [Micromonospora qiuiae]